MFGFVQFLDANSSQNIVKRTLNCIRLGWAAENDHSCTAKPVSASANLYSDISLPWFGLVFICTFFGSFHVLCQMYTVFRMSPSLHLVFLGLYLHRFYCDLIEKPHSPTSMQLQHSPFPLSSSQQSHSAHSVSYFHFVPSWSPQHLKLPSVRSATCYKAVQTARNSLVILSDQLFSFTPK